MTMRFIAWDRESLKYFSGSDEIANMHITNINGTLLKNVVSDKGQGRYISEALYEDNDGYYICREIRKESEIPIIIVTSRDSEMDELMSMNLGADDFVTKPYNTAILLARIAALLKRASGSTASSTILKYKDFELNLSNASITYKDKELELTKNEVKILSCLIESKGAIVSRDSLIEYLWKSDYFVDDSTLTVNITRLRRKLEGIGIENAIETRRGLGYIMP